MPPEKRPLWLVIRHEIQAGDKPHHAATHVLRRMKIERPPVLVEALAKTLGVTIVRSPSLKMAGILQSTREDATMWVNGSDQGVRQRFTIAHELGHLLLHGIGIQFRDHAFGPSADWKENQANEFAASLLMPLWMLEPLVIGSRYTAKELAEIFDISVAATNVQLKKLL